MTADTAKILEYLGEIFYAITAYVVMLSFLLFLVMWKLNNIFKLIQKDD